MREFSHEIQPMYTDFHCKAAPSELARIIIGDTVTQMDRDGIPRQRLIDEMHGAWMVDKFSIEQFEPIPYGSELTVKMSPRREKGVRIYYTAEIFCGEGLMARSEISFFAVEYEQRSIIRLRDIADMWSAPALPGTAMPKAVFRGEMASIALERVRMSDCDSNHHLSSPKYLDFICDATKFWDDSEKLCRFIQVDYVSECRPGAELNIQMAQAEGKIYVRGAHDDGSTAFDAVCLYE